MSQETQTGLCINLEGCNGEGDRREVQNGRDICLPSEKAMAPHSSTLAWRIRKDRVAWQVTIYEVKELDITEQLST